jgi:hypothetical protein
MQTSIEVEIDSAGHVQPLEPNAVLPQGRALLVWPVPEHLAPALLSERSLADWLRPEEDAAWAYLQPEDLQLDK